MRSALRRLERFDQAGVVDDAVAGEPGLGEAPVRARAAHADERELREELAPRGAVIAPALDLADAGAEARRGHAGAHEVARALEHARCLVISVPRPRSIRS